MKKKVLIIIVGIVLFCLFLIICCPFVFIPILVLLQEEPPKPEIKYGEFEYSLTYSINEEKISTNGILVCEYDGVSKQLDGASNSWNTYIKGTDDYRMLISEADSGRIYLVLPADARYYMNDPDYELYGFEKPGEPWFIYENYDLTSSSEEEESALEGYEIVYWQIEEPIENIFK